MCDGLERDHSPHNELRFIGVEQRQRANNNYHNMIILGSPRSVEKLIIYIYIKQLPDGRGDNNYNIRFTCIYIYVFKYDVRVLVQDVVTGKGTSSSSFLEN